jgi:mono/diheme cytochrome c family protein
VIPAARGRRALLVLALAAGAGTAAATDEWVAPAPDRARSNPVPDSPKALAKGRALFQRHCTACHGPTGKGDGAASTEARDLTDAAVQSRLTDGEIFWKIGTGRKKDDEVAMPAFARQIGVQDRWKLVRYVRSLAGPATAPPP